MERIDEKYREEIERFNRQKESIKRLWNIDRKVGEFLYRFIEISRPKTVLELGTSNGYSTFWLSIALEKYNGKIYSIESDKYRYNLAVENLKNRENVILINDLIENALPKINRTFDMVFIDANKSDYLKYLKMLLDYKLLNNPCVILADNVISHKNSVEDFVKFITTDKRFYTEIEKIGSGMSLSVYEPK